MADGTTEPTTQVGARRLPMHRRSLDIEAFDEGDELFVVGRLRDSRPWAAEVGREMVHDMELDLRVRRSDLVITEATAIMHAFPHAECPGIEAAFAGLVGMSVGRGYTRAVSERFVGVSGCSHIEHLARAIGPAVVQAVASGFALQLHEEGPPPPERQRPIGMSTPWLKNTCHIWAEGGVGEQKIALGRFASLRDQYPVPSLEVLRALKEEEVES